MTARSDGSVEANRATTENVPAWTRVFVGAFLTAFVICGLFGVEAWPLSGFRLFSHVRTVDRATFVAVTVDADGIEDPIPFKRLPAAYRGFGFVARALPSLSPADRLAACRVWADVAELELGRHVAEVRVYRLDITLLPRAGERAVSQPVRTLAYGCTVDDPDASP